MTTILPLANDEDLHLLGEINTVTEPELGVTATSSLVTGDSDPSVLYASQLFLSSPRYIVRYGYTRQSYGLLACADSPFGPATSYD